MGLQLLFHMQQLNIKVLVTTHVRQFGFDAMSFVFLIINLYLSALFVV